MNGLTIPGNDCSWYTPNTGQEEYAIVIPNTSAGVTAYTYTITVILKTTGESKTLSGTVVRDMRNDTTIAVGLKFGGAAAKVEVLEVQGLVPVGMVRGESGNVKRRGVR
jgi:hypothetical protein